MGKSENKYADKVRYGDLPKEERKAVKKVYTANKLKGGDNSNVCAPEIGTMLHCFEANEWETAPCQPQIDEMYACVELHKHDPNPKHLVASWQKSMRACVMTHFVKAKVMPRLR